MAHAHIVVIGNQKGGSGKSTTSMHLIVSLLHAGYSVGSIDLDDPQATLTRYLENRRHFIAAQGATLALPDHQLVKKSIYDNPGIAQNDDVRRRRVASDDPHEPPQFRDDRLRGDRDGVAPKWLRDDGGP